MFSYDDASGKEVARIISFKTPLDAYESNEDDSYITRRYSERLAKIEEILGDLENSFIIGHSLGGIRALNMVTEIENSKETALVSEPTGVIGLAATFWWQVASESKKTDTAHRKILDAMEIFTKVKDQNTYLDEKENIKTVLAGIQKLLTGYHESTNAVREEGVNIVDRQYIQMAMLAYKPGNHFKDIGLEKNDSSNLDPQVLGGVAGLDPATQQILYTLNLGEHLNNGTIYKKIARIMSNSRKLQSTDAATRINWFKNNTLPTHLRYISLSVSLPDPYSHVYEKTSELRNLYDSAYILKDTADYQIQRSVHLVSFKSDFIPMSDGTTNVEMSQLQPRRHMLLNPNQKFYKAENIGLLVTDHISPFLPSTVDKDVINKFPRHALIKALSSYINETK